MNILALIPARGGSKGIPNKNIANLAGKPLILHTLCTAKAAQQRGLIANTIVSTDCEKIRETIQPQLQGAQCIERPLEFSTDSAKTIDVVLHAVESEASQGNRYDAILLLQPTSPLRTIEDIENSIHLFESHSCKSLISVYEEHTINETILYRGVGDYAQHISPNHNAGIRRQEHGPMLIRNGAIYVCDVAYLQTNRNLICEMPLAYTMPKRRSVNIDTLEDLQIAEKLMKA